MPFFCAVPIGTPADPKGVRMIPSAGPYYVASYVPKQGVVLRRNPNYTGGRPHRPDRITLDVGLEKRKIVTEIEAGRIDYTAAGIDPADIGRLASRYGPGSPAARRGRQQYFATTQLEVDYIWLNLHRPLFADVRLRQAVNYAVDRRKLASVGSAITGLAEEPSDQYLPPGMPGFKDVRIYPLSPDVATAKRLAGDGLRRAVLYTCAEAPSCKQFAQVVKTNLAAIGIDVDVKSFGLDQLFARLGRKNEPYDLTLGGWAADYPDPSNFLNGLFGTGSYGDTPGIELSDPVFQRKLAATARLAGPSRYLAYAKLDADTARNHAPAVPLGNYTARAFFSARMGCQVFQPVYGIDLAALCIRR
jgi:peptide/nickel transport system substrate-binding protein